MIKFHFSKIAIFLLSILVISCSGSSKNSAKIQNPSPTGVKPVALQGCGNGVVEGMEECDGGSCCSGECKLVPANWNMVCDNAAGTTCTGKSSVCSTNQVALLVSGARAYDPALGVTP